MSAIFERCVVSERILRFARLVGRENGWEWKSIRRQPLPSGCPAINIKASSFVICPQSFAPMPTAEPVHPVRTSIAGHSVPALARQFGTPAYVYDAAKIIERVNAEVSKAVSSPDVKEKLRAQFYEPYVATPAQFAEFTRNEVNRWSRVIKDANIQPE